MEGLQSAECAELPISSRALPHLIGKRGRTIRRLESALGVLLGVMDMSGDSAIVSVVGPRDRVVGARRIIELVSKGARSLLDHLETSFGIE